MANNIIDSIQLSGVTYQIQGSGGGVPESTFTAYTASTDSRIAEDEEVTAAGLNALNDKITPTVELTQAEYDALTTKDPNTYYIITDAQAGDLTNYYTKSETNTLLGGKADTATTYTKTEVDTALSGKQATLVSGTNIKTINNESILGSGNIDIQGGGGKVIEAGTNISVTTGTTADTINCTLPISVGTNTIEINKKNIKIGTNNTTSNNDRVQCVIGENNTASGIYSFAFGVYSKATNYSTVSMGYKTTANNQYQASFGRNPLSSVGSSTFGDSGNTLFVVGNATGNADADAHNAFEIRQNGDIYLTLDGQDVKLQDQLGGSSITVDTALDSGSTNPVENRVIYNKIDEVEQVTAAALNNINDNFGGLKLVKLSQTEYNALTIKDASTLYIILG